MRTYKCKFCNYKIMDNGDSKNKAARRKMGEHYETKHKNLLPPDMDGYRYFYFLLTKKDHGSCVMCHKETEFNRETFKYCRFCTDPKCKQAYKEERDKRMMGKYGKLYVTDDPDFQRKMLANRKISGQYRWSDGSTQFGYVGSYELDFLKFLDLQKQWPASDLMVPSPHTYTYKYNGQDHFYIPDMFIPSMSLEIEIKSKARMDYQNPESRDKEIEKNKMMETCSNMFNYLILFDKDYSKFESMLNKEA